MNEASRVQKLLIAQEHEIVSLKQRIEALEKALRSIAANTCCDSCQEAALVARAALEGKDD